MMNPSVNASPSPAASPTPTPAPSPPPKFIQFSGFADAAYTSRSGDTTTEFSNQALTVVPLTSGPATSFATGSPFASRVFDYNDRTPDLQNLNLNAALTSGNLTGKLELSAGTDADIIQSYPGAFNGFDVTQAYLAYQFGKLNVQAGKFETLAGSEVIESPSNLNFSRSILFGFAVPFTHTGGRLTYAVTPHLNAIGGVNAGWDEVKSTNGRLTAEYGLAFTPSAAAVLNLQGYTGYEQLANYTVPYDPYVSTPPVNTTVPGAQGQRTLIDAAGTLHPSSAWTLTFNYDHGLQHNYTNPVNFTVLTANWSGLAGYAAYQINPRLQGALRYEGFHDPQGYRTGIVLPNGDGQFWREGTATLSYALTSAVTLRGEYRHDVSDQNVFLRTDNTTLGNTTSTFALEGFVKF